MTSDSITRDDVHISQDTDVRLEELARISLYRSNAFQVLQLPVRASAKEISKRQQMAEIAGRTGAQLSPGPGTYVVLSITPEPSEIGRIARELQDPLIRLFHEFFWLWADKTDSPPVNLTGLPGLIQQKAYWKLKHETDKTGIATHNLAVLSHASAIELEQYMIAKGSTSEFIYQAKQYWEEAYSYWHSVQENDKFWDLVTARIREMDDAQLTTGTARRLRASLPGFLLNLHARLVIQSIEQNRITDVQRHSDLIQSSRLNLNGNDETIKRLIEPVRGRVRSYCKASRGQFEKDQIHADKTVQSLINQCQSQLNIICSLLPNDSMVRKAVFEEYVETCLEGAWKYYRKTDDSKTMLSLLEQTKNQGMGERDALSLSEARKQVAEEAVEGNYWHYPGYFELPVQTITLLEMAYEHCNQGRLEKARDILARLFKEEYWTSELSLQCISVAFAYCLNHVGLKHLDNGYQASQRERTSVFRIKHRAQNPTKGFNLTAYAIENNLVEYWGRMRRIECMACGNIIYGGYYIIRVSEAKAIICNQCHSNDQDEIERTRNLIKNELIQAQNNFYTACKLNAGNKVAETNLQTVREIYEDMNFDKPKYQLVVTYPDRPVNPQPAPPKVQPNQSRVVQPTPVSEKPKVSEVSKPITSAQKDPQVNNGKPDQTTSSSDKSITHAQSKNQAVSAPKEEVRPIGQSQPINHPDPSKNISTATPSIPHHQNSAKKLDKKLPDIKSGYMWIVVAAILIPLTFIMSDKIISSRFSSGTATQTVLPTSIPTQIKTIPPTITLTMPIPTETLVPTPFSVIGCSSVTLNIREGPGTNYSVIAGIPQNGCVKIPGRTADNEFFRVETVFDGKTIEGWAASQYLKLDAQINPEEIPIYTPMPTSVK